MKPKTKKMYQVACIILALLFIVPSLIAVIMR